MGIIVSCLTEIVVCLGECIMGIFGAIADCLGCVIAGTPYLSASCHPWGTSDERRAAVIGLVTGIVDCICDCLCCG